MGNRIPLTIHTEEALCLAVQLRASKKGVSLSDVVNAILREALTHEIAETASMPPLAAIIQTLHESLQSRLTNGSHRLASSPGKLTK
jgi:hypothetical protein